MSQSLVLPLLPLRDVVVYPHMVIPLFVGRDKSIKALERAMAADKQVMLVAQRDAAADHERDAGQIQRRVPGQIFVKRALDAPHGVPGAVVIQLPAQVHHQTPCRVFGSNLHFLPSLFFTGLHPLPTHILAFSLRAKRRNPSTGSTISREVFYRLSINNTCNSISTVLYCP